MSTEDSEKLVCYNRGCGQTFDPSKNSEDSCIYHPGSPVFHDAYKKWSCCEKKTTDFTEFLNIKGCSKAYHSNVKPELPKSLEKEDNLNKSEVITQVMPQPQKPKDITERPDANCPMKKLHYSIGSSLTSCIKQLQIEQISNVDENSKVVKLGTPCNNSGCKKVFKGEQSNDETCIYHAGTPVFHEGLKYWTCCVKRTTDFDSFLEQVGCTTGRHLWHRIKPVENKLACRYDWHQTGNSVVVSVYSKCPLPELSTIEANAVKLKLYIVFGQDKSVFDTEIVLFGVVDVDKSSVTYLGSKVEINLKKSEPESWKDLHLLKKMPSKNKGASDKNINNA